MRGPGPTPTGSCTGEHNQANWRYVAIAAAELGNWSRDTADRLESTARNQRDSVPVEGRPSLSKTLETYFSTAQYVHVFGGYRCGLQCVCGPGHQKTTLCVGL